MVKEISRQIEERDARTLPMLNISSKPAFITKDEHGNGVISIVVTNNGDSTAESFMLLRQLTVKNIRFYMKESYLQEIVVVRVLFHQIFLLWNPLT